MKKLYIFGLLYVIIGLLIAIGPFTFLYVCDVHESDMIMKCHWTAMAELGQGIGISILGLVLFMQKDYRSRLAVNLSLAVNGVVACLIPNVLIGVCDGIHMHCHAVARPALSILSTLTAAIAVINIIYLYGKGRGIGNGAQKTDN